MLFDQPAIFLLDVLFIGLTFIWLGALTVWLYKTVAHYKRLVGEGNSGDLKGILEKMLAAQGKTQEQIKKVEAEVLVLGKKLPKHLQKVGLVRFNPFKDAGGNQSFALALLNQTGSGVVVLSLHSREGTRVYIKPVTQGRAEQELSQEEKGAVEEAIKS